jgi:hypothetical protein
MNAMAFALCASLLALVLMAGDGAAQNSGQPKPQIVTVTGGAYVLPRQAGTKDAPDVTFLATPVADARQGRTDRGITEQSGPGSVQGRRR